MSTSKPSKKAAGLQIIPASLAHATALAELLNHLNAVDGNATQHSEADAYELIQQSLMGSFSPIVQVPLTIWVAVQGGVVLGVLIAYPGFDVATMTQGFHISDMVVFPHVKRQGVGRALMQQMARFCLQRQGRWLSLTSMRSNIVGHKFYQALGFQAVDVQFFAIGKNAIQLHLLR